MNRYLSRATRRMEKEEKKTQLAWMVPIILHRMLISGPHGQYLPRTSMQVSGMVKDVRDGQGGDEHISRGEHLFAHVL